MWALGVILYECCTLKRPFEANNQCALIMKIVKGRFDPIPPENASAELIDVVGQLLTMDPRQRPSAHKLLSTRLIQEELQALGLPLPVGALLSASRCPLCLPLLVCSRLSAAGCVLLALLCWLSPAGCLLRAVSCELSPASCLLQAVACEGSPASCLLQTIMEI